jgi:DNA-binding MarR family transcriptional regulator
MAGAHASATMHAIFFGLKRAFHGVLRISRDTLATLGLTSARFDLLYVLHECDPMVTLWQSEVRVSLGVSAQVVSRMLQSLEELGLVTRRRSAIDRRQRDVELTPKGRSRIRFAIWSIIRSGQAKLAVELAIGGERWFDESHVLMNADRFDSALTSVRVCFRDTATLYYPWHPDD